MERKTAHDFDQELLILFDAYVHGALDRRGFLDKAAKYAVGGVTAAMLLDQLSPKFAEAQVVKPEDARLKVEYVEYDSPERLRKMRGYLAQPGESRRQAAGDPRDSREPRPQSAHRGHRTPPRARQLRCVRAGCAVRRSAATRGRRQGTRALRQTGAAQDARRLRRGGGHGSRRVRKQRAKWARSASAMAAAS